MTDVAQNSSHAPVPRPDARGKDNVIIRFESITKRFGNLPAVDNVTLDVREGEFFALLGPSGCGKTTLLRMLAGFETPTEGRILIDEMAYVAMPEAAAEYLFQIISGRAERASVIVTTNLPFSEWTTMFPNARLCKAMLDRLTDQAHIIETGNESHRFRRTLASRKGGKR